MVDINVTVKVPALEKLLDYAASGIGSVAAHLFAARRAENDAWIKRVSAQADADVLRIEAQAQADARNILVAPDARIGGKLDIAHRVTQRITFQEEKRQRNIESVVTKAADQLGHREVPNEEPDHDWVARFFNSVQDVSEADMQVLWANVLAGEVERRGSTTLRTLDVLRNLDHITGKLFHRLCSIAVFLGVGPDQIDDARVPSLGGSAGHNSLARFGLPFDKLNRLNEHGLIIGDYNSWHDYQRTIGVDVPDGPSFRIPFVFQGTRWVLVPTDKRKPTTIYKLSGVALTFSGRELSRVVTLQRAESYGRALRAFWESEGLVMTEVE